MPVTIHHPEPERKHKFTMLIVQVAYDRPNDPKAKFRGTLYGPDYKNLEVPFRSTRWFGNLCGFVYPELLGGEYWFHCEDGIGGKADVHFWIKPTYDVPNPAWPRARDTVTSFGFIAYGVTFDPLDVAASQTMEPSPTAAVGGEVFISATTAGYSQATVSYQVTFPPTPNGQYLISIVDDNGDMNQQDPVQVNHP